MVAAPLMVAAAFARSPALLFLALFLALFALFLNNGPFSAAVVNAVSPTFRAFAVGINILFIHLLGDAASPTAIGWIGQTFNLGTAIAVNALPVLVGGAVVLLGTRYALANNS